MPRMTIEFPKQVDEILNEDPHTYLDGIAVFHRIRYNAMTRPFFCMPSTLSS